MNQFKDKLEVGFAIAVFIAVTAFIVSGFMGLENCWDKYKTEEQAIINCEGVNND
jgi:hypothetical protein